MDWSALNPFWAWVSSTWAAMVPAGAVEFPNTPADGQEFGRFYWNNDKQTWDFS